MRETTKLNEYRKTNNYDKYFNGIGVDIGCGNDVLDISIFNKITNLMSYDIVQNSNHDANYCLDLSDNYFDFVYSSHCLEHMIDPYITFKNWIRICKPHGYLIIAVPHELFYEKYQWPSKFNTDHKTSWSLEIASNLPNTISTKCFLNYFAEEINIIKCETILKNFDFTRFYEDQTLDEAICQIEFIVQKKNTQCL